MIKLFEKFDIEWVDGNREPQCKPNPDYPDGVDVDLTKGAAENCTVQLPYPAKRCGHYVIVCNECKVGNICTTAGRPDDPRSIKIPCNK